MIEEQLRHSVQTRGESGRNVPNARAYPRALEQTIAAVKWALDEQKQQALVVKVRLYIFVISSKYSQLEIIARVVWWVVHRAALAPLAVEFDSR